MKSESKQQFAVRVLVVDDEKSIRVSGRALLSAAGYEVETAEDARAAKEMLRACAFDVVVCDIVLPALSGVELLREIRQSAPAVQVIMMTGEPTVETASEAVRTGACDYLSKPVGKQDLLRAVGNAARLKRVEDERKRLAEENAAYRRDLERRVKARTRELEEALQHWREATEGTIHAMAAAVESRDPYTAGHQERVARLGRAIAERMDLPAEAVEAVYHAGLIHDLGKISVPAEILSNPGRLCREAMSLVKKHPAAGHRILAKIKFPWDIAEIVFQHHERFDGSGYPRGLTGDDIMREARILGVADVVEAMASHRPYRAALGIDAALAEIRDGRGVTYDSDVVDACLSLFREKTFRFDGPA